jgi:hypothetical protein
MTGVLKARVGGVWEEVSGGGGIPLPPGTADGQVLTWDGTAAAWVPEPLPTPPGSFVTGTVNAGDISVQVAQIGINTSVEVLVYAQVHNGPQQTIRALVSVGQTPGVGYPTTITVETSAINNGAKLFESISAINGTWLVTLRRTPGSAAQDIAYGVRATRLTSGGNAALSMAWADGANALATVTL